MFIVILRAGALNCRPLPGLFLPMRIARIGVMELMQALLDTAQDTASSSADAIAALRCHRVTKRYRGVAALEDVSLDVGAAETVAVLGLNGAGKTSLLRLILDFSRADSGTIEIFGIDSREAAARRQLAFLPERFSPAPN
ncbi:MAG: ATP-binding cassette domain-containing protein [Burkholderiaceae bacterium]